MILERMGSINYVAPAEKEWELLEKLIDLLGILSLMMSMNWILRTANNWQFTKDHQVIIGFVEEYCLVGWHEDKLQQCEDRVLQCAAHL